MPFWQATNTRVAVVHCHDVEKEQLWYVMRLGCVVTTGMANIDTNAMCGHS